MPSKSIVGINIRESAELTLGSAQARKLRNLRVSDADITRFSHPASTTKFFLDYCFHLAGDVRNKTVLDFGCGTGSNSVFLSARGANVLAMDVSSDLVEITRRRLLAHGFNADGVFVGTCHRTELPDESVDCVFGTAVLHHLDLAIARDEVWRILKPGGIAVFHEPVRDLAALRLVRKLIPYKSPDCSPYERPLRLDEITEFSQGFVAEESRWFEFPVVYHLKWYGLSNSLLKIPPLRRFGGTLAFRLRKPAS